MIDAIDSSLKVAIAKTYNSRLSNEFNASLMEIRAAVKESPFLTMMLDGWMWHRNESVLGCVISIINYKFKISMRCVGNFYMKGGHSSNDIDDVLGKVI